MTGPSLVSTCARVLSYLDACMVRGVRPDVMGARESAGPVCDALWLDSLDELRRKGFVTGLQLVDGPGSRLAVVDGTRPTIEGEEWLWSVSGRRLLPDPIALASLVDATARRAL